MNGGEARGWSGDASNCGGGGGDGDGSTQCDLLSSLSPRSTSLSKPSPGITQDPSPALPPRSTFLPEPPPGTTTMQGLQAQSATAHLQQSHGFLNERKTGSAGKEKGSPGLLAVRNVADLGVRRPADVDQSSGRRTCDARLRSADHYGRVNKAAHNRADGHGNDAIGRHGIGSREAPTFSAGIRNRLV